MQNKTLTENQLKLGAEVAYCISNSRWEDTPDEIRIAWKDGIKKAA
jgi:hypothetical protein